VGPFSSTLTVVWDGVCQCVLCRLWPQNRTATVQARISDTSRTAQLQLSNAVFWRAAKLLATFLDIDSNYSPDAEAFVVRGCALVRQLRNCGLGAPIIAISCDCRHAVACQAADTNTSALRIPLQHLEDVRFRATAMNTGGAGAMMGTASLDRCSGTEDV
jgi:hypothetical protein